MKELIVHSGFAALWMTLALAIAMKTALIGNEQAVLARHRGADLKIRRELSYQNDQLRADIEFRSSPSALAAAVRRVDLPLQPLIPLIPPASRAEPLARR